MYRERYEVFRYVSATSLGEMVLSPSVWDVFQLSIQRKATYLLYGSVVALLNKGPDTGSIAMRPGVVADPTVE